MSQARAVAPHSSMVNSMHIKGFQSRSPERDELFFSALRAGPSVTRAYKAAGYTCSAVYNWRKTDSDFAARWDATLNAKLGALQQAEKARLAAASAAEARAMHWSPNPGPQTDAFESPADLVLYGGAAGGGKTELLLGTALMSQQRSVIFRRNFVDLRAVEERMIEIVGSRQG